MNVLVINGSPKGERSNTMKLTHAFLDGAGWTGAEIINVQKAEIQGCIGCYACWNKTPGKCVIDDDMNEIIPKIIAADIIIWAFPLYVFGIPGKMKCLIDRQLPLKLPFMSKDTESGGHPSRYDLSKQRHIVISTCGFFTTKGNYDAIEATFNRYYGENKVGASIFCGQGELFRIPELRNLTDRYLEIVRRAGEEFVGSGIQQNTKDELLEPLLPRDVFENAADASWGIEIPSENRNTSSTLQGQVAAETDESLKSTTQMAAFFRPDGIERVLEFHYTDIQKTYQILLTKSGSEVITENFKKYTTKIETPYTLWRSIARGEISGQEALFKRQYKILGDMEVMMKWDELFGLGGSAAKKVSDEKPCKTNMRILLAPWIIIWVLMAINETVGGVAGVVAVTCMPLFWMVFKPVVYERITAPIVAGLSLAVLLGIDIRIVLSASYGLFGLMWLSSTFTKIPLTAYYSAYQYDGEAMFENPIFMKTNRILTAAWGVLYLITTILAYVIMGTNLLPYTGLITSIVPIGMGLFTAWFSRWYPERSLRG